MIFFRKYLFLHFFVILVQYNPSSWYESQPVVYFLAQRKLITACNIKKIKLAHTRLPSVGFQSWSRFLAVSLQVTLTWVINPAVGCHYFPSGMQLPPQPLRGLVPVSLLGEQRRNGCEQFAWDSYPTASRLRFEPGPFCAWVQHANHSATEPQHVTYVKISLQWTHLYVLQRFCYEYNHRRLPSHPQPVCWPTVWGMIVVIS